MIHVILVIFEKVDLSGANLINILAAFFKPTWVLIFSVAAFESYKKIKHLDFLAVAQKKLPALGHYISSYGLI